MCIRDRIHIAQPPYSYHADWRDVQALTDEALAQQVRDDRIDILVDLTGWTANARYEILLHDPAPVNVNWLGNAGSMGHRAFAAYLIGDAVTTPESSAPWFSEALALMPRTYMPTDNRRVRGPRPSRVEAGLPDAGVVFCCFNQPYKITPDVFAVWCQLLHEVPDSVLWLASPHRDARANLLREAASRGIDAPRLVFAPFTPTIQEHLGRLQLPDIATDTPPSNPHSPGDDELLAALEVEGVEPPELAADFPISVSIVLPDRTAATLIGDPYLVRTVGGRPLRCLLYTSPSPRDRTRVRMPSSA